MNSNLQIYYNEIRETQAKIQSEMSFSKMLNEQAITSKCDEFDKFFFECLVKDKCHYVRILISFFLNYPNHPCKPSFKNYENIFGKQKVSKKEITIPDIFNIRNLSETIIKSANKLDAILIDVMSFSTIPSLFLMYLEEKKIKLFIKFIGELAYKDQNGKEIHDLQFLFSRSLFFSPMFLDFAHNVFYSIFNQYFNGKYRFFLPKNIPQIQEKVLQSIKSKLNYLPSFVNDFLKTMNDIYHLPISSFLKQNLFDPMAENPSLFTVVDACFEEDENKKKLFKKFLPQIINPIIDQISNLIENNDIAYNSYINPLIFDNYRKSHQIFEAIDNMDIAIFEKIQKLLKKESSDITYAMFEFYEYVLYKSYFLNSEYLDDDFDQEKDLWYKISSTIVTKADYWGHFRKLIKESSPLPQNYYSYSTNPSFDQMINDTLVEKYNPFTSVKDNLTFLLIKNMDFTSNLNEKLDDMVKKHIELEEALSKIEQLINESKNMYKRKKPLYILITIVLFTKLTANIHINESLVQSISQYKTEQLLDDNYQYQELVGKYYDCWEVEAKKIYPSQKFKNKYFLKIFTNNLWKNLDFNKFLSCHRDLVKYDNYISSYITQNISQILQYIIDTNKGQKVYPFISTVSHNLIAYKDYILRIRNAFEENLNPFLKWKNIFKEISIFEEDLGIDGPDLKEIFKTFSIICANPPHMISSFAYFYEFLCYTQPKNPFFDECINSHTTFISLLKGILNPLLKGSFQLPLHRILKCKKEYYEFIITGDNTTNIALTYNAIMIGSEQVDKILKNDDEINQFAQKIENEVVSATFSLFSNNTQYKEITFRVFKKFTADDLLANQKKHYIPWGFYGTSCESYSILKKSEEETFSSMNCFALKIIVPQANANKDNLSKYNYKTNTLERDNNSLISLIHAFLSTDKIINSDKVRLLK